jgi:hypothetical protein
MYLYMAGNTTLLVREGPGHGSFRLFAGIPCDLCSLQDRGIVNILNFLPLLVRHRQRSADASILRVRLGGAM